MFRSAEPPTRPPVPTFAIFGLVAVAVGSCVGCALLVAELTGFPLVVLGGCACVVGLAASAGLVVYTRRREGSGSTAAHDSAWRR